MNQVIYQHALAFYMPQIRKFSFIAIALGLFADKGLSQDFSGVGIRTDENPFSPSAILDVAATDSGMLIPRMTTAQRNAILGPGAGLMIFNTDCNNFNVFNGTEWSYAPERMAGVSVTPEVAGPFCAGDEVTLIATTQFGGDSPSLQWQNGGEDIPGATGSLFTFTAQPGDAVRCVMTSTSACVTSAVAQSELMQTRHLAIGDFYEGGIIFKLEGECPNQHGLVVAPMDQSNSVSWQDAVDMCDELVLNGYADWHLPSWSELSMLETALAAAQSPYLNSFAPSNPTLGQYNFYLTSVSGHLYWFFSGGTGNAWGPSSALRYFRAIRAF
jgi:hypothetical protein